jgi:hypothetical protein
MIVARAGLVAGVPVPVAVLPGGRRLNRTLRRMSHDSVTRGANGDRYSSNVRIAPSGIFGRARSSTGPSVTSTTYER